MKIIFCSKIVRKRQRKSFSDFLLLRRKNMWCGYLECNFSNTRFLCNAILLNCRSREKRWENVSLSFECRNKKKFIQRKRTKIFSNLSWYRTNKKASWEWDRTSKRKEKKKSAIKIESLYLKQSLFYFIKCELVILKNHSTLTFIQFYVIIFAHKLNKKIN